MLEEEEEDVEGDEEHLSASLLKSHEATDVQLHITLLTRQTEQQRRSQNLFSCWIKLVQGYHLLLKLKPIWYQNHKSFIDNQMMHFERTLVLFSVFFIYLFIYVYMYGKCSFFRCL